MNFLKQLADTNVQYWTQPPGSFLQISVLLGSNSFLLILCRSASFGFESVSASIVMALATLLIQYLAAVAVMLRPGAGSLLREAPKLAQTMAVVWLLSLVLFVPNALPGLRWFDIQPPLVIAVFHSVLAIMVIAIYSRRHLADKGDSQSPVIFLLKSLPWILFLTLSNAVLFYLFVLHADTHYWLLENLENLENLTAYAGN
tara:strand:- start:176611 stop:177213 length:603 start_codon:yes stop_codon:yes gene_type:complete